MRLSSKSVVVTLYNFRLDFEETASQRENSLLFPTKTCCLFQTKSNVCNLKKVFLSRKTCSNAAHQLVDGLLLLCKVMKARYHYVYQHNDRLKINLHSLHWYSVDLLQTFILKLELAKYYKDSEMTAFISERSRNSK